MVRVLKYLLNKTLNNVIFGISLMVLIAGYIAIGSGVPAVREHFEMDELAFFNAWPLKLLVGLLIASLVVVTWIRIPLTPPRYGVWCVHLGIIILVFGMVVHYNRKVEGLALVPVGQRMDHYYDRFERSLYVKVNSSITSEHPLPGLPRFKAYSQELGNTARLERASLQGIRPSVLTNDPRTGRGRLRWLGDALGLNDELTIDVIEYHPYADIVTRFEHDPAAEHTGLKLTIHDPHAPITGEMWLVASDPQSARQIVGNTELEHRHVQSPAAIKAIREAAARVHRLDITAGTYNDSIFVEVGRTYELGPAGYSIEVEDFLPAFPMFGTGELAKVLTLKVSTPTQSFRRQVLADRPDRQTDFRLDVPGAGPFGQRQTELIDPNLNIHYRFTDPHHLMPAHGSEKQTFITTIDQGPVMRVLASTSRPAEVAMIEDEQQKLHLCCPPDEAAGGSHDHDHHHDHHGYAHSPHDHHTRFTISRVDNLRKIESIEEVPPAQRTRQAGEMGIFQTIKVRVQAGDWSETFAVPFAQYARLVPWETPRIRIPGSNAEIELQLGNRSKLLPAAVSLERFELVPYPGGDIGVGIPRDFRSTLLIEDPRTGEPWRAVAHMNNPVYFRDAVGDSYLYFQAAWDPEGQRWTVLGVGNRPAVWVMIIGSTMIFTGLLYAFYVKPIIIRRMKQQALDQARKRQSRFVDQHEQEPVAVGGNGKADRG